MLQIKICGVRTLEDAAAAREAGADAVGLNFFSGSPRFIEPEAARHLVSELPPMMKVVGVFVETRAESILETAKSLGLNAVQTYSDPTIDADFHPMLHLSAFRVREAGDLNAIRVAVEASKNKPAAVLIDSYSESIGGSGIVAPWQLLAGFDPGVPVILAGGLTPENVAQAIRIVRPHGVDVASGVESRPGVKDAAKMRDFVAAARAAFAEL